MKVWVVHYYDCSEVEVCTSQDTAIQLGRGAVDKAVTHLKFRGFNSYAKEIQQKWLQEISKINEQKSLLFDIEDIVYCDIQETIP